jgi:hypothetical protein
MISDKKMTVRMESHSSKLRLGDPFPKLCGPRTDLRHNGPGTPGNPASRIACLSRKDETPSICILMYSVAVTIRN